ncbi:hypothetical protein A5813_001953 [Enterococcus faecium]|uniref:restriction endonuclease subunit S n=1 Tax=Enterococcus faecium TaxID=1352 RepID=UPI000A352F4A|nr:restriction endonuclease subunit S [Enterococcus faecium]OTO56469.1 hypothetical protein A5813_001953 [Enterococcus faecium]OTO61556.1 hypothetical protein A5812_000462 [Enterococcus faecium]
MSNDTQPEIRFPGFTEDWEQRKLGDLGSVAMNKRIFKDQTSDNGEVPFFKIGTFGSYPDAFISRELFEEYKSKYPYPEVGDILISASGSIGRTVVYQGEDEYFQDSNIVWLKHNGRLDNKFLQQFYSIVKWQGLEGSTIKRLYNKNILDTNISVPTLDEQNKLGAFFEQLDDTIALHQRKLDLLKETKKGFLQKMFPKNGAKVPEIRFPGFTEDWEQRKLINYTKLITKGTTPKDKTGSGKVNFVKVENLSDGKILPIQKITEEEHEGYLKRSRLEEGDILFSIAGTLGRTAIVNKSILPANTNQALAIIRSYDFDKYFLVTTLTGHVVAEYIRKNPTVGAQPNLSLEQVGQLIINTPIKGEQKKIGNFFKQLDDTITLHQRKLDLLKEMKKGFLQKMFV